MFPWSKEIWLYAKANNYRPNTRILRGHGRSFVNFVQPANLPDTTESRDPLLIPEIVHADLNKVEDR